MSKLVAHVRISLFAVAAVLLVSCTPGAHSAFAQHQDSGTSLSGSFYCRSCDSNTAINLSSNGQWNWGGYGGTYSVQNGEVTFSGVGGPGAWGAAQLSSDGRRLTFNNNGSAVVYAKPAPIPAGLPGTYACQGCQTIEHIVILPNGTWKFPDGTDGGDYRVFNNQVQFSGLSSGPGGWGPAVIEPGGLRWGNVVYHKM